MMMARTKMADKREAITLEFQHQYAGADPREFTATAGLYPNGGIGEAFIHLSDGKEKTVTVDARDAAVLLSFALQYGAPLREMAPAMLRGADDTPHGLM